MSHRAFAGATVHDLFNLLNVLVLLPVEIVSGYLEKASAGIVGGVQVQGGADGGSEFLDVREVQINVILHIHNDCYFE